MCMFYMVLVLNVFLPHFDTCKLSLVGFALCACDRWSLVVFSVFQTLSWFELRCSFSVQKDQMLFAVLVMKLFDLESELYGTTVG